MSDFAWTLIDIRTLKDFTHNTIYVIKKMRAYVGWDKCGAFVKASSDGMDGISTDLLFGVLVPMWQGKEGRYPSCRV